MPKNHESMPAKEAPEKKGEQPEARAPEKKQKSPEDKQALNFLRDTYRVMDEYEKARTDYELELLDQKKAGPPTEKQKKLKSQLQEMWNQLQSMHGQLAEHEFMIKNEDLQKSLAHAREKIDDLHEFTGQETAPAEKTADTALKNRESIKLNTKEALRNRPEVKKLRTKLARLKSSFAGAYKMSPARADILLSQPTGVMGALKGLYEGKMPTSEERKKLKALRSDEAQEMLSGIKDLEQEIEKAWKKAKKEEALQDAEHEEIIEEVSVDESVSIPTLRETFTKEINQAKADKDLEKAEELKKELDEIYGNLYEHFPELIRIKEDEAAEPSARETILPSQVEVPVTARDFKHEPKVILSEEKASREAPTLRSKKEEAERQDRIQSSVEAFGGGEAGRKYAADLWNYANNQIKEQGGIKLQGEKGRFKDALEYVNAFAEKVAKSNEILGRERSAQIWQEINDHRNELLQSESLTAKEKQKLQELDPVYYVEQSALRDKALQEDDLDAAGKHNAIIDEINQLLGYPEGMNPSTGEGMGRAPQAETKGLGKRRAAAESAGYAEKTGLKARTTETGTSRERISEPIYSVEWAARILPNARAEWDKVSSFIKANEKPAKKAIKESIKDVTSRVKDMINAGADLSPEFQNLNKLNTMRVGEPAEATRYVMLKAASELTPVTDEDATVQQALVEAVAEIDGKLLSADLEKAGEREAIKNKVSNALGSEYKAASNDIISDLNKFTNELEQGSDFKVRSLMGNIAKKLNKHNVPKAKIDEIKEMLREARNEQRDTLREAA
ncbi:hypothetical protein GF391_01715 [Candidatus Uhrbacteria bacterium]|nr:hypothetical protein [Candidatus Uhrbacteria bacterium]